MQALFGRLRAIHGFAALLVTHDVDEAILLSDRLLVLDDGHIIDTIEVDLGHPRAIDTPGFATLRRRILTLLRVPATPDEPLP
jgi:sulfonate transport system ATP-binding protein